MSNLQRASATPERDGAHARLLPVLSELRKEVRALSQRAHRMALARASAGAGDYREHLRAIFEQWIEEGVPRVQVICFASAAEFGLPMHKDAERCRAWAMRDGSHAVRALYWAALHRMRSREGAAAQMADASEAGTVPQQGTAPLGLAAWPVDARVAAALPLCRLCEELRLDARCAGGHGSLRPLGEVQIRSLGTGVICQTREHQCKTCKTYWWQLRSAANLFTGWTISRRAAER